MPSIISYRKFIDALITREINLPVDANNQRIGTELATLDGVTYVSMPDGVDLPEAQPAEIAASIARVTLDQTTAAAIKATSPHVRLINQRVADKISERYSVGDEIKLLRTAPSPEFELYNAHTEECRAWGREQKAALGLA